jgi:hypothetical protein
MKTAMQELIEYLNGDTYAGICDIRDRAEELLEKEERQIIDAFENGYDLSRSLVNFNGKKYFDEEFEYYNQTYNQNES